MDGKFDRTEMLIGKEASEKLKNSSVIIFGIGGVGSYVVEALVRGGIGSLTLVDGDTVSESNINRQLVATEKTVGMPKVEVAKAHCLEVNSSCMVEALNVVYTPDNSSEFDLGKYDYVVDAIDSVKSKVELIVKADEAGVPVISSMGAGNKLDPTAFRVTDIYKTQTDPLAKVMRHELRAAGINKLKVVYSEEIPVPVKNPDGTRAPGSVSFVPSACGLVIASEVIKDLIK